jgi:spermidine/putrescine transport system substrate-binding protein
MKKIWSLVVLVLFIFALASCESKPTLKVFIWGEYIDMDLVELFEETYNVNVDVIIFESNEAAVLQVKSSSFDIIVPSDYAIEELANGGLLQEIDWDRLENISQTDFSTSYLALLNQIEDFAVEDAKILDFAVPYFWGNIGIIYNKDVVSEQDVVAAGWDILARKDLRVMFYDIGRDATMIALRALYGQSINPNLATDAQLAAAEQWLINARGPRTRYLTTEIYDVFTAPATIDVAHAFSGEAIYMLPENDKLGYHVPTSGTNVWMDMLAIPKNAEQTDLAYLFIDFFMSYENALTNSITVGYTSPRADVAQEIVDQEIYGPEYQVQVRPYDQIHRYKPELKTKIEQLWSRVRAQ